MTRLKNKDQHTAQHSLNVAVLSIIVGRNLGFSAHELEDLGVCAMLHDVGKTNIPTDILNKEGPLTEEESKIIRAHTKYGRDILLSTTSVLSGAAASDSVHVL